MNVKRILAFSCAALLSVAMLFPSLAGSVAYAGGIGAYQVFKSGDTVNPVAEVNALSDAFDYINAHAAADGWIVKATADDPDVGSVAELNAPGAAVALTSSGGTRTLHQTEADIRHINVAAGALTLTDITLDGASTGGGIVLWDDTSVTMDDGSTIMNCRAPQGGGIASLGKGTLTMNAGSKVSSCQATYVGNEGSGGGIYSRGNLNINEGTIISGNTAIGGKGGGVAICDESGLLVMVGGTISGNTVAGVDTDSRGGGVAVSSGALFNMYGGVITGNKADIGGGVSVWDSYVIDSLFKFFSDNRFNMYGGEITDNHGAWYGGGVAIGGAVRAASFVMTVDGGPKLYGNLADLGADDFYSNGVNTTATLIPVSPKSLPQGIRATNWYQDNDQARYREPAADKAIYADSLLTGITDEVKLTIGLCHTVTFDSMAGSTVGQITGVVSNATISAPPDPSRPGYTFGGWYLDKDCTRAWDFHMDKVTNDVTLYAKWTAVEDPKDPGDDDPADPGSPSDADSKSPPVDNSVDPNTGDHGLGADVWLALLVAAFMGIGGLTLTKLKI